MKLHDTYGRTLDYVRISITDRCNFRCRYCMPEEGIVPMAHESIMTYEDIIFLCQVLEKLGVRRIRFTGGEPMVRKGFMAFLERTVSLMPNMAFAVTTNGTQLLDKARRLAPLNLEGISISLDSLKADRFKYITRCGSIDKVLKGIDLTASVIPNLKINTVLIRGFNDDELSDLLSFSHKRGMILRFIEFMPLDHHIWREDVFISVDEMISRLPHRERWVPDGKGLSPQSGPAFYYKNLDTGQKVGFIAAVSHHFCKSCNRLRITASGEIRACLFSSSGIDLMESLKKRNEKEIARLIFEAAENKPRRWMDVTCGDSHMSQIGG